MVLVNELHIKHTDRMRVIIVNIERVIIIKYKAYMATHTHTRAKIKIKRRHRSHLSLCHVDMVTQDITHSLFSQM